ncbi:hypothetical protein B0H17DRAFT_1142422 [Mycena rosella]|uniref:Uncharacterized protein n=1 Tax=Mycena rosella TaxID=1033263 RepID=A0AAD7CX19_MYCRO|nr:hypothetical protein B0H17DRAFT_1142422 [Mycena rosella]
MSSPVARPRRLDTCQSATTYGQVVSVRNPRDANLVPGRDTMDQIPGTTSSAPRLDFEEATPSWVLVADGARRLVEDPEDERNTVPEDSKTRTTLVINANNVHLRDSKPSIRSEKATYLLAHAGENVQETTRRQKASRHLAAAVEATLRYNIFERKQAIMPHSKLSAGSA